MEKAAITVGKEYAVRERRIAGSPFQRVRVLKHVRGNKWRVQWLEPNSGLTDYVESGQIIVLWKDHKAFLDDEANSAILSGVNKSEGFEPNSPIVQAIEEVFQSMGDDISFNRDTASGKANAFSRIKCRANFDGGREPYGAYTDRHGIVHWPFLAALQLAQKFCAAEPSTVLVSIEAAERELAMSASRPGEEHIVPLLNQYRASWALIRQWTGHDPAVAEREAYIDRLQRVVWDAIYALQKAGLDSEAARLRRILENRCFIL